MHASSFSPRTFAQYLHLGETQFFPWSSLCEEGRVIYPSLPPPPPSYGRPTAGGGGRRTQPTPAFGPRNLGQEGGGHIWVARMVAAAVQQRWRRKGRRKEGGQVPIGTYARIVGPIRPPPRGMLAGFDAADAPASRYRHPSDMLLVL